MTSLRQNMKKKKEVVRRNKENVEKKDREKQMKNDEDLFCIKLNKNKNKENREGECAPLGIGNDVDEAGIAKEEGSRVIVGKLWRVRPKMSAYNPMLETGGVGAGRHKGMEEEGFEKHKEVSSSEVEFDMTTDENSSVIDRNPMAIVPYSGRILNEVMNKFTGLGLKREAKDSLEPGQVKKRRIKRKDVVQKPKISVYPNNLRKIKEKAKRTALRKQREEGRQGTPRS